MALVGLGAPSVGWAAAGLFSRYAADDYCTAGQVHLAGFLDAQSRLYVGWSGRFAATFLVTLAEVAGPLAVPGLPVLALLAWLAATTWAVYELLWTLGRRVPVLAAVVLAAVLVFATLRTTADLGQALFWQTGLLTYLFPLVLATVDVGWLARVGRGARGRAPAAVGVSFALSFVAGGTSETFAAAQVTALALAGVIAYLAEARPGGGQQIRAYAATQPLLAMLLAGLVGAVLAMVILAVAPGNNVRQQTAVQIPLAIALPRAVEFTQGWLRLTFARPHIIVLLLLVGIPSTIGAATESTTTADPQFAANTHNTDPRTDRRAVAAPERPRQMAARAYSAHGVAPVLGLLATALVLLACMLPAFYALGSNPPGRAQVVPQYVLVCSLAVLGWLLGTSQAARLCPIPRHPGISWLVAGGLLVLLALGPLRATSDSVQQIGPARAYAAAWDQLDRDVRAERRQGVQDVTVRPLPPTGLVQNLDFVGPNRHDWFNECVARYYDLNTIASTLSVP